MSDFLKPQSPLRKGEAYIYPLTTVDQVILEDNSRLNAALDDIKNKVDNIDLGDVAYAGDTLNSAATNIKTLFEDKEKTSPIFPITKINAVSDDNGVGLDAILNTVVYAEEYDGDTTVVPLNADTLGGYTANEFINIDNSGEIIGPLYSDVEALKNSVSNLKFKTLTTSEYEALSSKDANTLYIITE